MARFTKGQRVKVARHEYRPFIGMQGAFLGYLHDPVRPGDLIKPIDGFLPEPSIHGADCVVHFDGQSDTYCQSWMLDPILDSYMKVEWKDCLWQPSPEKETA